MIMTSVEETPWTAIPPSLCRVVQLHGVPASMPASLPASLPASPPSVPLGTQTPGPVSQCLPAPQATHCPDRPHSPSFCTACWMHICVALQHPVLAQQPPPPPPPVPPKTQVP